MSKSIFFWIEPYVHINVKGNNSLFYNTLNSAVETFWNSAVVSRYARRLQDPLNMGAIRLRQSEINGNKELKDFIETMQHGFMGDIMVSDNNIKPVHLVPTTNIQSDYGRVKDKRLYITEGYKVKRYLTELKIILNSESSPNSIDMDILVPFLRELRGTPLTKVTLEGFNVLGFEGFGTLIEELGNTGCDILLRITPGNLKKYGLPAVTKEAVGVEIDVNSLSLTPILDEQVEMLENALLDFSVTSVEDVERATAWAGRFDLRNYKFSPVYTGDNIDFFRENIFISTEDFNLTPPIAMHEIIAKTTINSYFFGKFTINHDHLVYANPQAPAVGRLGTDSVKDLLLKELSKGRSWKRLRKNVSTCKQCVYNLLCPPVSEMESRIGRNNLCTIFPG
ncbi:MAG: hypothetical protein GY765_03450 [bacterium]|nr:hypothetical protein [bacterium]